ncbi:MAG: glycosyltransferase N-terminal domain-containing protein [Bdellovibrionota bacterium]
MLKQIFLTFYEIAQISAFFILNFVSYFVKNKKLKLFLGLRSPKNFVANINIARNNFKSKNTSTQVYWFHVSSAGEMEQAIPVARKLHEKLGVYFFVTYYSFSAEPFLKNFPAAIGFSGLPLDIRFLYKKVLNQLPVTKIFFVRYDIWPALLLICKKKKLEINLISATKIKTKKGFQAFISANWNGLFYKYFSHIFTVSVEDLNYFKNLSPNGKIVLAGDAKWARAKERAHSVTKIKNDLEFCKFIEMCKKIKELREKKILVIGSPHSEEHELVLKIVTLKEKFFIVYVPHDVEEKLVQTLMFNLNRTGYECSTYSNLAESSHNLDLVIIDKVGFLAEIYQIADAALIGGGFDGQIHNVLEAAAAGAGTLFGSSYARAREASELVQKDAALCFESTSELFHFLSAWVNFTGEESQDSAASRLARAQVRALQLFQNLPDTSEVVFNAISKN